MLDNFPPNGVTREHLQITNNKEMPKQKQNKETNEKKTKQNKTRSKKKRKLNKAKSAINQQTATNHKNSQSNKNIFKSIIFTLKKESV